MSTDPKIGNNKLSPIHSAGKNPLVDSDVQSSKSLDQSSDQPVVEFVVGIGASAGGLQSVEKLLEEIPSGTNSALVIVQHFSPDVVSSMAEILSRSTSLKILMVTDGVMLQPDTIFLIPPGQEIKVAANRFSLCDADRSKATRVIDILFTSLAASRGSQAIGIVLSGTGSDGSEGIKAIRDAGGATLAESYETAQFDGMPKNAMQTGCVDHLLSPSEIAKWLNQQFSNPSERPILEPAIKPEELTGIELIFSLLTDRHKVDFSEYKPSTVARRIERRQQVCKKKTIQEYADFAQDNIEELDLLYHDLLIGVTKFFRDTDAFLALERCLLELVKAIPANEPLRIWSAGCATGEEPYSLAMLAHDAFTQLGRAPNFKVFATDIHQGSLDFASHGVYDNETMEYVSAERQAVFFGKESATQSRVNNLLRRNLVFARHNVFHDPPFTKMHLVTCRNLLIYLKNDAQMRAISSFHFALKVDGLMMLGSSETVGPLANEFRHIDKGWRIFQKISDRKNLFGNLPDERAPAPAKGARQLVNILNRDRPESMSFTRLIECYDLILKEYVPCGLLLDDKRNILHTFGDAGKYLNNTTDKSSGNLTRLLEGDPKVAITAALIRSRIQFKQKLILSDIEFKVGETTEVVDVQVCAYDASDSNPHAWLVEFVKPSAQRPETDEKNAIRLEPSSEGYGDLETELIYTRDSLSISIEQLESSNEELSAANEELVASNEELQSTNEELESVNEELYTVNLENNRRIDELKEVTDDFEVLLSNSDVGTLFLDTNLCIRKFTRSITEYFDLLPHDIGRPIDNFTNKTGIVNLDDKLTEVLETGEPFTDDVSDPTGQLARCKIVPHIGDGAIAGVVLTISGHRESENEHIKLGFWRWPDVSQDEMWWSAECYSLLGLASDMKPTWSALKSLVHPDDQRKIKLAEATQCTLARDGAMLLRISCEGRVFRQFRVQASIELTEHGEIGSLTGSIGPLSENQSKTSP